MRELRRPLIAPGLATRRRPPLDGTPTACVKSGEVHPVRSDTLIPVVAMHQATTRMVAAAAVGLT